MNNAKCQLIVKRLITSNFLCGERVYDKLKVAVQKEGFINQSFVNYLLINIYYINGNSLHIYRHTY